MRLFAGDGSTLPMPFYLIPEEGGTFLLFYYTAGRREVIGTGMTSEEVLTHLIEDYQSREQTAQEILAEAERDLAAQRAELAARKAAVKAIPKLSLDLSF